MPDSLSPSASTYLKSVAEWFAGAQIKTENANMSRCVDKGRFEALKPFLKEVNLEKAVFQTYDTIRSTLCSYALGIYAMEGNRKHCH
jgi:hypothetical protein